MAARRALWPRETHRSGRSRYSRPASLAGPQERRLRHREGLRAGERVNPRHREPGELAARRMIALLDNGQDLDQCAEEIGVPVGQLLTPLTRYRLRDPSKRWAIDNGGFNEVDVDGLMALLEREAH